MIVLLDTNAFIWWVMDSPRLGLKARASIANPANDVYVSNLTLLECAIKIHLGKLKLDFDAYDQEIHENRFLELSFDSLSARQYIMQKSLAQADPFDRAIIAQAVAKHMVLVTGDDNILAAVIDGLQMIDATK